MLVVDVGALRRLVTAVAVVGLVACAGRNEEPAKARAAQCQRLRDHVIDLRLASAANVDIEAHRKAMQQALGRDFVASCTTKMTAAQVDCALAAKDSGAVAACGRGAD